MMHINDKNLLHSENQSTAQTQPQLQSQPKPLAKPLAKPRPKCCRAQSPLEKRLGLIAAMGHFRPKNATPVQFYNYVREFCIMHNCSIDEAMERTPDCWTKLSKDQRQLYNSEMHAALPIPVPRHLIYRAFQMERVGRWKLNAVPAANGGCPTYSVESYAPPTKPTKLQTRLRAQHPRFDNLAENSPCSLVSPRILGQRGAVSAAAAVVRTLTPPEQRAQRAQQEKGTCLLSLTRILSEASLKGVRKRRVKVTPATTFLKQMKGGGKGGMGGMAVHTKEQQQKEAMKMKKSIKWKSNKLLGPTAVRQKQVNEKKTKQTLTGSPKAEIKRKHPKKNYKKKSKRITI